MPSSRSSSSGGSSRSYSTHSSSSRSHGSHLGFREDRSEVSNKYMEVPKRQSGLLRFMAYAAGQPSSSSRMLKQKRDAPDYYSSRGSSSGRSSSGHSRAPETRMYWVRDDDDDHRSSSSSIRTSRNSGTSRPRPVSHAGPGPSYGVPRDGHFVPPPVQQPHPVSVPLGGGRPFPPPPQPMSGGMPAGAHFGNGGPPPVIRPVAPGPGFRGGPPVGRHPGLNPPPPPGFN